MQYSRGLYNILEIEPCQDPKNKVGQNLSPEHVCKQGYGQFIAYANMDRVYTTVEASP